MAALLCERVTLAQLLDVLTRAEQTLSGVAFPEAEPRTVLRDLGAVRALCQDVIGASHMGCAADEVLLQLPDDAAPTCPDCGSPLTDHTTDSGEPTYCDECDREVAS